MPTNKPKIQIILDERYNNLLKEIADKEMRSISQMGGYIIKQYLDEWEAKQERSEKKEKLEKSSISRTG